MVISGVIDAGKAQNGPNRPRTPDAREERTIHSKKVAHMSPQWMGPWDHGTPPVPALKCLGTMSCHFRLASASFGPGVIWAEPSPSRLMEAWCMWKMCTGQRGTPTEIGWTPKTFLGATEPTGRFILLVLLVLCCLLVPHPPPPYPKHVFGHSRIEGCLLGMQAPQLPHSSPTLLALLLLILSISARLILSSCVGWVSTPPSLLHTWTNF